MGLFLLSLEVHGLSHVLEGFKVLSAEEGAVSPSWFMNMTLALHAFIFLYGLGLDIDASPIFIHIIL